LEKVGAVMGESRGGNEETFLKYRNTADHKSEYLELTSTKKECPSET